MAQIKYIDTDGDKSRLLPKGSFGMDEYLAGGDVGRVWVGTGSANLALAKQSEIASVNLLRADKYLAAQNVVNMEYNAEGKLAKVQYNNPIDDNYEVLSHNAEGKLSNVAHYVGGVLQGNTVLSYSNGKLVSAPYTTI